jgi:hypothetical protein
VRAAFEAALELATTPSGSGASPRGGGASGMVCEETFFEYWHGEMRSARRAQTTTSVVKFNSTANRIQY